LVDLYLTDNELTNLPPEIGQMTNLFDLHLGGNSLTSLPQELRQLPELRIHGVSEELLKE